MVFCDFSWLSAFPKVTVGWGESLAYFAHEETQEMGVTNCALETVLEPPWIFIKYVKHHLKYFHVTQPGSPKAFAKELWGWGSTGRGFY